MSRRQLDLESGVGKETTNEKSPTAVSVSTNRNPYFPENPESYAPYLQDLHDAIQFLQEAYNPDGLGLHGKAKTRESFFSWVKRRKAPVRFAFYLAPIAILLVIPIALLSSPLFFDHAYILTPVQSDPPTSAVHAAGLVIWLEIITIALWVAASLAWLLVSTFNWVCDKFKGQFPTRQLLCDALKESSKNLMMLPITLIIWTIIGFATTSAICIFDEGEPQCNTSKGSWIYVVNRAFEAGIVVSFILWVERLIIGMSFVSYYGKQYESKHGVLQSDIAQVRNLFYLTLHRQPKHKHKIHDEVQPCLDCKRAGTGTCLSSWQYDWNDVFRAAISREETAMYLATYLWYAIKLDQVTLDGLATDKEIQDKLKEDILTKDLRDWICDDPDQFTADKQRELFPYNADEEGKEPTTKTYTDILNGDNDEDVTYEEMHTAIKRLGRRSETLEKTLFYVREAMESLDRPLSVIVLIAVAFVYAAFFVDNFNTYATAIFTAFTGLGFALSGTVTDFLTSCIFLFVKHPYYVGDRIEINKVQLFVDRIALMTTRFTRVDNSRFVQLPHSLLNTYWIENLSRSKKLKEYFTITVAPDTSFDTIDLVRHDLHKFVERNARDFKQDSVGIELSSMTDLTMLKLDVEVEHKFKYFDDDVHSDRQSRFKRALLSFLRVHNVSAPGVDPMALGDPWRPSYSITPSAEEVALSKAEFEETQEAAARKKVKEADWYRMEVQKKSKSHRGTPMLGTPSMLGTPGGWRTPVRGMSETRKKK